MNYRTCRFFGNKQCSEQGELTHRNKRLHACNQSQYVHQFLTPKTLHNRNGTESDFFRYFERHGTGLLPFF